MRLQLNNRESSITARKTGRTRQYRPKGQSLTAAGKLHPEQWKRIPKGEVARALTEHEGLFVKEVKKIHHLQHQVCISYIDTQGNACSSFFSYRIFESWQKAVERLIYACLNLNELYSLGRTIQYDVDYFPYPVEIADAISTALETNDAAEKKRVRSPSEVVPYPYCSGS